MPQPEQSPPNESNGSPHQVGDILYVKEPWIHSKGRDGIPKGYHYEANEGNHEISRWKPSSDMPPAAARIFFKVTAVHIEQLWDIEKYPFTHPDIDPTEIYHAKGYLNEGLLLACSNCQHANGDCKDFIEADTCKLKKLFKSLWNKRYAKFGCSWKTNPWVWVFTVEQVDRPINFLPENKIATTNPPCLAGFPAL